MSNQPSIFDYLNDEVERRYILRAWDGKLDDDGRLEYAAAIQAKDPQRADWLRLEVQLHRQATSDERMHQRLGELGRGIAFEFKRTFRRENILNCGKATNENRLVRFSFACSKRWETLHPTEDASVRHCNECQTRVHYCNTVREAESHARAGHCIAVPISITDQGAGGNYRNAVGRPDPIRDWGQKLFPEDA